MTQPIDLSGRSAAGVRTTVLSVAKPPSAPGRTHAVRRLLRNPLGVFAVTVLAIFIVVAIFADVLAPFGPNVANIGKTLADPDAVNLLGTDSAGRDILSRLIYGARTTLLSAALCAVTAIAIGLPAGLIAGYYGGPFDHGANWVVNVLMALPAIIILLAIRATTGPSVWISMIAFGILLSPGYFRLTRTAVQSVRNELYVDAARVSGLSDMRIISRHIFSVVRAPIIIHTALVFGIAVAVQSGLEFLGLGDPTVATWGVMLSDGFRTIYLAPLNVLWPALAIGLIIGAFTLLGNAIRDALEDPEVVARRRRDRRAPAAASVAATPRENAEALTDDATPMLDEPVTRTDDLLTVSHLQIGYPQTSGSTKSVVHDVSFHVRRGEVLGIVGESGSGKTQTAFAILGLLPANAEIQGGFVRFDNAYTIAPGDRHVDQRRLAPLRGRRIAYIPQEPMSNLDPAFTVGQQLTRPMVKILGIRKGEAKKRALKLLADVGIADPKRTFHAYPHEISGGMAQRVLIAGAVSCEPELIIADEPTTALDVTVQAEVLDLLRDLQSRLDLAVIIVTHNFGVVADLCDRVVVMQSGRLVEEGPVRTILGQPSDPYTRSLLDSMLEGKQPLSMLTAEGRAR